MISSGFHLSWTPFVAFLPYLGLLFFPFTYLGTARSMASWICFSSLPLRYNADQVLARRKIGGEFPPQRGLKGGQPAGG
jgi:hypothetical protein